MPAAAAPTARRPITAEDLYRVELITGQELSPDGHFVAYTQQRVDKKTEKKFQNIFVVATVTGQIRPFTQGDCSDSQPRWSPDGKYIAFVSNRRDEKQSQIFVIPFDGGEARQVTKLDGQFGNIEWSPDGQSLLVGFRRKDADALKREKDEDAKKLGVVVRHIKRVHYREDGEGFLPEERWHLVLINVATGEAKWLTDGTVSHEGGAKWSPDGTKILFQSNRTPEPDLDPDAEDLWLLDVATQAVTKVATPIGPKGYARFSPDGKRIAYVGSEGRAQWGKHSNVWVVPADSSAPAVCLTESHDLVFGGATINDLGGFPVTMAPTWSVDGKRLYMQASKHGQVFIASIDSTQPGAPLKEIVGGPQSVSQYNFDREQRQVAYLSFTLKDPGQVLIRDVEHMSEPRRLTNANAALLAELDLGEIEEAWVTAPGGNKVHGWITKPPQFDPTKKYPSILQIHGGPLTQYGFAMTHEFFYLAAAGYVVHYCNPRGGLGYGQKHAQAIWNKWGTVDYDDVMAWTDFIEKLPFIDPRRMAVTGGSYGGYMTNWIIARTHRFVAAVTQRCVSNMVSMFGSSDYNWHFMETMGNQFPWDNLANYWAQSPISAIGNARTPTLVVHSEGDLRCAMEQGEQVFVALKKLGVPTEYVLFPDEPHGMSRSGRTDRRISRLQHIRRRFDTFVPGMKPAAVNA